MTFHIQANQTNDTTIVVIFSIDTFGDVVDQRDQVARMIDMLKNENPYIVGYRIVAKDAIDPAGQFPTVALVMLCPTANVADDVFVWLQEHLADD